ncbi:MAG: SMC-Scp complex subunit ScpB [Candidatus Omnitrophica bacterium]|nr:SMC-Scp complex subunit ScpB [Candidatus Omnitrophota bacterium]
MDKEQLSGAIEALIFVSGDPVSVKRLLDVLEATEEEIRDAVDLLSQQYIDSASGIQILEVAGGFQLRTQPRYSEQVNKFLERKRKTTLSGPALETLAIIAYKQPITRAEIEVIRGVVVDGVIKSLLDKRLIKVAGVKEVPGRPNLYRTTKRFLEYFGIISLKDLPPIDEIEKTFAGSAGASGEEPVNEETPENGAENESPDESIDQPESQPDSNPPSSNDDQAEPNREPENTP